MNMFGKKNTKKRHDSRQVQADELIGKNLNFSATEAYKLLRTNLFFCLPPSDESKCPVVGVTSSVQGEGKSTTSVNLAYMLAEDGKRVCLIEGDMRAPTLRRRLNIKNSVGLSHVLAGLETVQSAISAASIQENLRVITAGEMPPNPAELLGSELEPNMTACTKKNLAWRVDCEFGATQGKFDLAKCAKKNNLDAIHDTVHEMAKDEV